MRVVRWFIVVWAAGLAFASPALATCPSPGVALTTSGPAPTVVTAPPGAVYFYKPKPAPASRIVFDDGSCTLDMAASINGVCMLGLGKHAYRVEGFGAGEGLIDIVPPLDLSVSSATVVFGQEVVLTGDAPFACHPPVTTPGPVGRAPLYARAVSQTDWPLIAEVPTYGYNETWTFRDTPLISTTYSAFDNFNFSDAVFVGVRPRVLLALVSQTRRVFRTEVKALGDLAGSALRLQRRGNGRWVTIRSVRLTASGSAVFRAPEVRGLLRMVFPQDTVPFGYLAGFSTPLRIPNR